MSTNNHPAIDEPATAEPVTLTAVPRGAIVYCDPPRVLQRMYLEVRADGTVFVRGLGHELEELIAQLRARGLSVTLDYYSLCG
jgi:hypothetical protein